MGVPGIITKETRKIVDFIRINGNKLGSFGENKFTNPYSSNLIDETIEDAGRKNGNLLLIDLGLKRNILKFLGGLLGFNNSLQSVSSTADRKSGGSDSLKRTGRSRIQRPR